MTVEDDEIRFCFRAKNRKLVRREIRNESLARGVSALLDLADGSRLFRYERDGEVAAVTADALNDYIGDNLGDGFTAKDFRTWGGTLLAAVELERHGPPEDEQDAKKTLAAVMRKVGEELGNTPTVARESYVSPAVVDHFLAGRTLADFRAENGDGPRHLGVDESALIALLSEAVAR